MSHTLPTHQKADSNPKVTDGTLQDFLVLYAPTTGYKNLAGAIHALYYLPENYKLVVLAGKDSREGVVSTWLTDSAIMNRIKFESATGLPEGASPFSFANAVIADSSDAMVVTEDVDAAKERKGSSVFAVPSNSPEALASAVLKLGRRIMTPSEIQHYA